MLTENDILEMFGKIAGIQEGALERARELLSLHKTQTIISTSLFELIKAQNVVIVGHKDALKKMINILIVLCEAIQKHGIEVEIPEFMKE